MQKTETVEVPIFPLNTVLFPGGLLPLKIFEQRYLDMTRDCLRDGTPFGVFLIREGWEVGTPASCEGVGCLAPINQWEMPHLNIFHLLVEGREKVRIREKRAEANGLIRGKVELLPEESPIPLSPQFQRCAEVLRTIIKEAGGQFFPQPQRYDDALWVGYRLAEVLPIALSAPDASRAGRFARPHPCHPRSAQTTGVRGLVFRFATEIIRGNLIRVARRRAELPVRRILHTR